MSKEFTRVILGTIAVLIVIPAIAAAQGGMEGFLIVLALTALVLSGGLLMLGVILLLPKSTRKYGQAFLLTAGLLLLASFTVCSTLGSSQML